MNERVVAVAVLLALAPVVGYVAFVVAPGTAAFTVASNSMSPAIPAGSVVYVHDTGEYDPGDVITYRRGGRAVTHRIVAETDGGYVTAGDANEAPDEWNVEEEEAIVGEVVFSLPVYGTVLSVVDSPLGYLLAVLLPTLVLLAVEARTLQRRVSGD